MLDVDGVLSPMPQTPKFPSEWGSWDHLDVPWRFSQLHLSLEMGIALGTLAAELCWLTTWDAAANDIIAPHFGWSPLPVVQRHPYPAVVGKYHAVAEYATVGESFIWAEDDIPALDVDGPLFQVGFPYLVVNPDPEIGLTRADVAVMNAFIEEHG